MILIASLLGGSFIGSRWGAGRPGRRLFLVVWLAVFAFQTAFLVATEDNPRHGETGEWDLGYFPFSLLVLLVGLGILHAVAALRGRRRRGVDLAR